MTDTESSARQLAKLDELAQRAQEVLDSPHYHMHDGQPVLDPETGSPLRAEEPVLRAMDVMLGVVKLRSQILGLDAPQRHILVDQDGNTLDVSDQPELLRRLGILPAGDD